MENLICLGDNLIFSVVTGYPYYARATNKPVCGEKTSA